MNKVAVAFLIGFLWVLSGVSIVYADVDVWGVNGGDTWSPSNGTYIIRGDAVISHGTVTVMPGTRIEFEQGARLRFFQGGGIDAQGTSDNHIIITTHVAAPGDPAPSASYPNQLAFTGSVIGGDGVTSGIFAYVDFSNLYDGIVTGGDSAQVSVDHCTFSSITEYPVYNLSGTFSITNSTFNSSPTAGYFQTNSFTHSGNTFNTTVPGWQIYISLSSGDTKRISDVGDGVYYPIGTAYVGHGAELIIDPGVSLYVDDQTNITGSIEVNGTLTMNGTVSKPITIYSNGVCSYHHPTIAIRSLFNGVSFYPSPATLSHVNIHDTCGGIYTQRTDSIQLSDVSFKNIAATAVDVAVVTSFTATNVSMDGVKQGFKLGPQVAGSITGATITNVTGTDPSIDIDNDAITVASSTIASGVTCLAVRDIGTLILTDSEIKGCTTGISIDTSSSGTVTGNSIHDNTTGLSLVSSPNITVAQNWWGSALGPTIADNVGGDGQSISATNSPNLVYSPWLGANPKAVALPPGGPVTYSETHTDFNLKGISDLKDPKVRIPIIIVPGIMGTRLVKGYGSGGEIWPNILNTAVDSFDLSVTQMQLEENGVENLIKPLKPGDIIRSVSKVDTFESLIQKLFNEGYKEGVDLFVFPYDWRFSNVANAPVLKDKIESVLSATGAEKVDIIAHSMGGILTKEYIAQFGKEKIDKLFFVGTPHLGAQKTAATLLYGDDMGFSLFGKSFLLPNRIKDLAGTLPSVFELLPSRKLLKLSGGYIYDGTVSGITKVFNLNQTKDWLLQKGKNLDLINEASLLHDQIDNIDLSSIKTYNFAGCGVGKTITGIEITRSKPLTFGGVTFINDHRLIYGTGDETVPIQSAMYGDGTAKFYVKNFAHTNLPSVPAVSNAIVAILRGDQPDNTVSISDEICNISGKAIEIHSPVSLHIYDEQGNHVGPLADGSIERNIDGVAYDIVEHEKFVFLPEGHTYKVVNKAEGLGTYDMYISDIGNKNDISHKKYFNNIPIDSLQMSSELTLDMKSDEYSLALDQDGDSVFESKVLASIEKIKDRELVEVEPLQILKKEAKNVLSATAPSVAVNSAENLPESQKSNLTEKKSAKSSAAPVAIGLLTLAGLGIINKYRFKLK